MDNDDVIECLNDLIEISKDGEYGFATGAQHLRNPNTRQLFVTRAEACRHAAAQLQNLVRALGGKAEDSGTAAGAVHRGWISVKSKLVEYTDLQILEETERGEDKAVAEYRDALEEDLPANVRTVVEEQYCGVQRNHDQIRALRDQARAAET